MIDSKLFLVNMGFPLYIVLFNFVLLAIYLLLYLVNRKLKLKCLDKILKYLASYLFWNGLIRLYMEFFIVMVFSSVLNMHTVDW